MRAYFTTTVEETKAIWRDGFRDLHHEFGMKGVWFASEQLDVNDGFEGDVTLCLDVPEGVFAKYEWDDPRHRYREALIPADVLNTLGKPQVYDHAYAGSSRRELKIASDFWEAGETVSEYLFSQELRAAMAFFDEIGWRTPLKLQESDDRNGEQ